MGIGIQSQISGAMKHRSMRCFFTSVAAVIALSACSNSGGANAVSQPAPATRSALGGGAKGRVLTYYIDQIGQDPQHIAALMEYEATLQGCRQGDAVITPLSAADMAKLGVRRVRVWQRPGENVKQIDTWTPVSSTQGEPGPFKLACHFIGVKKHSIREVRIEPNELYVLDLTKDTGTYELIGIFSLARPSTSLDLSSQTFEELKDAGFEKLGTSQTLGQPCQLWKGSDAQGITQDNKLTVGGKYVECDWSGGAEWGFADGPGGDIGPSVLWRKMDSDVPQHPGWLKTTEFDVGHLPADSDKVFEIPKSISIRAKTAGVAVPRHTS